MEQSEKLQGQAGNSYSGIGAACALILTLIVPGAHAQTPDAGSLLQTIPSAPARPATDPTMEDRLQKARPIADIEGLQVEIKTFRLTGITVIPEAEAQVVVAPFLGPDKKFQDLLDAAAALKKLLAGRGYFLADAFIPEQSIKDGIVEIMVMEGHLGKVKIDAAPDIGISTEYLEGFLASLHEDSVIQTRTVERAVFLLSDLKGVNIRTIFEPGEKVGTANLIVQVTKARSVEGNLDVDTMGSYYTGELRVGGGVDFNNAAGIGDMLSLRYARSAMSENLEYQRISYLAPAGRYGLKLGMAYSDMAYRLRTPAFDPINATGRARVHSGLAALPLIRSRNMNLIVSGQIDVRSFRDRKETAQDFTDKDSDVTTIGISGDLRDGLFGGGVSVYNAAYTRGELGFVGPQVEAHRAADAAGHKTAGNYKKANFSFSRMQSLAEGLALYVTYAHQLASKNLDSSEKFSLGGPNAVRAYPQGEASGDEGWTSTAELRWRIPTGDTLPGTMVLTAFHDAGEAKLNKNKLEGTDLVNARKIAGLGFGINWEVAGDWSLRGSVATRQTEKPLGEGVKRDPRVYLQFSKLF